MSLVDVHEFDGKWSHNIQTDTSLWDKCRLFSSLVEDLNSAKLNHLDGVLMVIKDSQSNKNYDPINKVYADDILISIYKKIKDSNNEEKIDTLINIVEQMNDMMLLGPCSQGRTTRLFQIYNYLM